ncbi:MAG: pyrroline-5-carboxylate reductase [Rikenellaceae bacterium]|nr:pyrroline-5-carboxylate reductase [Rikenellaceae bacterium]
MKKIAVIGGGNMGGALIAGFLKSGKYSLDEICVADKNKDIRNKYENIGTIVTPDNIEAVSGAEIIILAVKPYLINNVAAEIVHSLKDGQIIVSIAAGMTLDQIRDAFDKEVICFRAIPNIAAEFMASMTFVSGDKYIDEALTDKVIEMFKSVGEAVLIDENLLDAAMVSASCGMAYALRYIRAAMISGVEMGLTAPMSELIVSQTVKGAAQLMLKSSIHPEEEIDKVSTPGGITIAGLNEMEHQGFSSAVISGHMAAYKKVKGE